MDEQVVQSPAPATAAPEGGQSTASTPTPSPASVSPAAEGAPAAELPANMQEAFNKRLSAAMARQEQDLRARLEADYQQRLAQMPPPPEPPVYQEENDEAYEQAKQEILSSWYDDPIAASERLEEIKADRKNRRDQAMQAQWNYHAALLQRRYSDWQQMSTVMQEVLQQQPDLAERPEHLDRVYKIAKLYQQARSPQVDSLLQDQSFVSSMTERFLGDQQLRQQLRSQLESEIIQDYVSGKRQQAQSAPPLMGGSVGGSAPAMPPNIPRTWEEAKRSALQRYQGT